jgi:hypothetical protein
MDLARFNNDLDTITGRESNAIADSLSEVP